MATNSADDECDLETLSALLEENDSDNSGQENDDTSAVKTMGSSYAGLNSTQPHSQSHFQSELSTCSEVKYVVGQGNSGTDSGHCEESEMATPTDAEDEEMDEAALSSMLEEDSDFEAPLVQEGTNVTADDIAAFFEEESDASDHEGMDPEQAASTEPQESEPDVEDDDHQMSVQKDTPHVKQLQDELLMMQRRMQEIQQLLSSQTGPPPSVSSRPQLKGKESRKKQLQPEGKAKEKVKRKEAKKPASSKRPDVSAVLSALFPSTGSPSSTVTTVSSSSITSMGRDKSSERPRPHCSASTSSPGQSERKLSSGSTDVKNTQSGERRPSGSKAREARSKDAVQNLVQARKNVGFYSDKGKRNSEESEILRVPELHKQGVSLTDLVAEENDNDESCLDTQKNKSVNASSAIDTRTSLFLSDVAEGMGGAKGKVKKTTPSQNEGSVGVAGSGDSGRKGMKRALFGEGDCDSDWDDMDGSGDKANLSSAGREIQKLMSHGRQERQAHVPSYPSQASTSLSNTWKSVQGTSSQQRGSSLPGMVKSNARAEKIEQDDKGCITEKFSGLRIKNPKISSVMMSTKMEGRKMIPISKLHLKVKSPDLQTDWVTIGVVVKKMDARKSQTGKTYCIWKLSDLQDSDTTVSFFLFGQVYKQLWKLDIGTVVGLLNPSIMDPTEKGGNDVAFTVNNCSQVMEVGQSRDMGWCIGKTKKGATCTNFINKKFGDFCTYHVQAAFRRQASNRGELNGSCPGTTPKSSLKNKLLQNNTFFYGGETYTSAKNAGGGKKDKVTLSKLQAQATLQDQRKVNTLSIQDLLPEAKDSVGKTISSQHQQPFLNLLCTPSVGSMNLVRHISKVGDPKQGPANIAGKQPTFHSVKASDLLKHHRQQIAEKIQEKKLERQSSSQRIGQRKSPSQSDVNTDRSKVNTERSEGSGPSGKTPIERRARVDSSGGQTSDSSKKRDEAVAASRQRSSPPVPGKSRSESRLSDVRKQTAKSAAETLTSPPAAKTTAMPMLGKGFYPGGRIDLSLDDWSTQAKTKMTSAEAAKRKAIAIVHAKGGVEKVDPNAVRKTVKDPEKIRKRILDNIENESRKAEQSGAGDGDDGTEAEPARKRQRLLGDVDPNSEEVKQLLKARSSHTGALAQAEADREELYFDGLEKKEMMEEKMKTVTSMEVTCFTCSQCKYTAMSVADRCKQEKHAVKKHKGKRRFFACKKCKHRTVSLQRYPTTPCKKCGESSFEKTSMHQEKSGPKLESEVLCLRGDESKFVNAMDQKVYMTTFEQE